MTKSSTFRAAALITGVAAMALWSSAIARNCHIGLESTAAKISRVIDGDTIELANGQRVRIIGMDTRELTASDPQDKLWGQRARQVVQDMLAGDNNVTVYTEKERQDRYGRLLGHIRTGTGQDVSGELIARGLAIAVAVGANTGCATDNIDLEKSARLAGSGLWKNKGPWWSQTGHRPADGRGFHVMQSTVDKQTGQGRKTKLDLANGIKISLGRQWPLDDTHTDALLGNLKNSTLEVRGWIGGRKTAPTLTLHHPANVQRVER